MFRRSDGELVTDLNPMRRMMPLIMGGRNQSIVYHRSRWSSSRARAWLRLYNRARPGQSQATLFHLLAYACMRTLLARPGLNRFVSGGRIYQRHGQWLSFALKTKLADEAPLTTVKLSFSENECFDNYVDRMTAAVKYGRSGRESPIDRETRLLTNLPNPLLRFIVAAGRKLDRFNLLPESLILPDPLFTSFFLANLGSIRIDNAYHHLYEYGTCSIFGVVGGVKKALMVNRRGDPEVRDVLQINWSFDERVNDAFFCMKCLQLIRAFIEDPGNCIESQLLQTSGIDVPTKSAEEVARGHY